MNRILVLWCTAILLVGGGISRTAHAQLTADRVNRSIQSAQRFLGSQQNTDGSWAAGGNQYPVGVTSLVVLALLNSNVPQEDPAVAKGLAYLRGLPENRLEIITTRQTYELSLMTMALAAADDPQDRGLLFRLVSLLEKGQITAGPSAGSWDYSLSAGPGAMGDRSNCQFAVLALREAAHYGIPVERQTWQRARDHWLLSQNQDGGWGYGRTGQPEPSRGSMTVGGIATTVITETMLGNDDDKFDCCAETEPNESLERAIGWMAKNFAVGHNPPNGPLWLYYYLYGLERAGRLSGRRFFGDGNDWYRAGAEYLVTHQHRSGRWDGQDGGPVVETSFALLFLSKGLAPVVVSKLKFGPGEADQIPDTWWNRHPRDVHHLLEHISGRDDWPRLMTWQVVELPKLTDDTALPILLQSKILYVTSDRAPGLTEQEVRWIRQYLDEGGTLFATAACNAAEFDDGFRDLVRRLYPEANDLFRKLPPEHPVYRAEYLLAPEANELWGIDFGCRTPVIYAPEDLGCFWERWSRIDPPGRTAEARQRIDKALKVGTNIVAYVTGREPPDKLQSDGQLPVADDKAQLQRGLLEIAKLRHDGGWDTAPLALRNLQTALNRETGTVSAKPHDFVASDKNILNFPLLYMHGRQAFTLGPPEQRQLREYLENGGVLFADACCGSPQFDRAFREVMQELFPQQSLTRIPADHELFTEAILFDVRQVTRRLPEVQAGNQPLKTVAQQTQPFLEGIEVDGRLVVIYSKYDISCALEKQASLVCNGYTSEDALRLAMNVVMYALLQDISFRTAE